MQLHMKWVVDGHPHIHCHLSSAFNGVQVQCGNICCVLTSTDLEQEDLRCYCVVVASHSIDRSSIMQEYFAVMGGV